MSDIGATLNGSLSGQNLSLPQSAFSGLFQTALEFFLTGITINLGPGASLHVGTQGGQLTLQAAPIEFQGAVSADHASLIMHGTGDAAQAQIELDFDKAGDGVQMTLHAQTGDSFTLSPGQIWPDIFSAAIFSRLALADADLKLQTNSQNQLEFEGTGSLQYEGNTWLNAALRIVNDGAQGGANKLQVVFGVFVPNFNLGSIWSPLSGLSLSESGLVFSNMDGKDASSLAALNLFNNQQVPSLVSGDFKIASGVSFFTTLQVAGSIAALTHIMGSNTTLALYAHLGSDNSIDIQAVFASSGFKPGDNAVFEFKGLDLEWQQESGNWNISLSADGDFNLPGAGSLGLKLKGTLEVENGNLKIELDIDDWVHPFGWGSLTVDNFSAAAAVGGTAEGLTLEMAGDFSFSVNNGQKQVNFGLAGELTDFEAPTGIAFLLDSGQRSQMVGIGDVMAGVADVNTSQIPDYDTINDVIQIRNFDFAIVESDSLTVGGRTFNQGFTLQADFDILQQNEINIDVEISKGGSSNDFVANAGMSKPVIFGSILTLSRSTQQGTEDDSAGPLVYISSNGEVIDKVNNGQPVYFYASCYLKLLDVISAGLYGIAGSGGMLQFTWNLNAGQAHANDGIWVSDLIQINLQPKQAVFDASFAFQFGWTNLTIGPITVFGQQLIPQFNLGSLNFSIGLSMHVDLPALQFALDGEFQLQLFNLNLNWGSAQQMKNLFNISLSSAPATLNALGQQIWQWLKDNIGTLIQTALGGLQDFINWVKGVWQKLGIIADEVAKILHIYFQQAIQDVTQFLKDIGYAASQVITALVNGLEVAWEDAEKFVDGVFAAAGKCAVEAAGSLGFN